MYLYFFLFINKGEKIKIEDYRNIIGDLEFRGWYRKLRMERIKLDLVEVKI